jgi:CPA1 family monovalent cation:H+ antiporter
VVVAGFVVGNGTLSAGYQTRLQERYVWTSVDVLLEAFVFAYIGLHLRFVLEDLRAAHESLAEVALASVIVLLIVLAIRPLSVFLIFGRNKLARHVESRLSVPVPAGSRGAHGRVRRPARWRSKVDRRSLSWQENVVVSWTGMRGVVTLAAAAAIPATTFDGAPFPERATIQAIAFVVAIGTLLIQGWTLPLLIRRLQLSRFSDDHAADRAEEFKTEQVVHQAAEEVLAEFRAHPPAGLNLDLVAEIRATIARQSHDAYEMPDPEAHTERAAVFTRLYRSVLAAQRAALITERDEGRIEDEAVRAMLERLDLQEAGVTARLESRL